MKTSSSDRPVKRSTALNCLLVNQFATPGLGSLMARRIVAGLVQLGLAVIGFLCVMGWFVQVFKELYRKMSDLPPQPGAYPWLGKAGFVIFAASWVLAWITSLSLLREARRNEPAPAAKPPLLR